MSKVHAKNPYSFFVGSDEHKVSYEAGESTSFLFGGNSNWRGPIWFPTNYMLIDSLERFHRFFGDGFKTHLPAKTGDKVDLGHVAADLAHRLTRIFYAALGGLVAVAAISGAFGPGGPL